MPTRREHGTRLNIARALIVFLFAAQPALAHDTWVQTNTNVFRTGDLAHIDLMLGNHGNEHRDFKLASKVDLDACTLDLYLPDGKKLDLKERAVDTGYAPTDGFWSARFTSKKPGTYLVSHTMDKVLLHGRPSRNIKSAKTCFVVSNSLDKVSEENPGFDRVLGHPLELIPKSNPVTPMGPGLPLAVELRFKGKPLAGERVSFIPRGVTLAEGMDSKFERTTDAQGRASFSPDAGNYYLIAAHKTAEDEGGKDFERTQYSATLTVYVPEICPCCE
jgi:uncharacterized GH25 family protein